MLEVDEICITAMKPITMLLLQCPITVQCTSCQQHKNTKFLITITCYCDWIINYNSALPVLQWSTMLFHTLYYWKQVYRRRYERRHSSKPKLHWKKNKKKNNKIWRKTIFNMPDGVLTPCNMARLWHWFRQVTSPCNVALESWQWIHQVAAPWNVTRGSGMTCHWIRPNVRHIGILHLVSILTILPQSTCHAAPVCEILSKSDHPWQKK